VLTAADGNKFAAYVAIPEGPTASQVIVYPDVRGLHKFYKELALRLAEQRITALAFDYFGRSAGLTPRDDSFEYMPHVQQLRFEHVLTDVRAALAALREAGGTERASFTLGFCMGGSLSLLTGTQDLGLAGVVSFYAGLSREYTGFGTVLSQVAKIRCPTLAIFGGADQHIPPDQVEAFDRELDKAGIEHKVISYPGAPHSFFDKLQTQYSEASAGAWDQVLRFISAHSPSK
jgi:carboxymethylenebutenolidase